MKNIILISTALLCSAMLTACGGGSDTAGITPSNPTPSTNGKLVIDNGRGTTNNQDTERVK
jgi:hypothetical protein